MPVAGTFEFTLFLSHIGSCNDTSHPPFILHGDLSCDFAAPVEICKIKGFFIPADLKYGICRSIYDHGSCGDFFFSQFLDNLCSAGTFISNDSLSASFLQFLYKLRRESMLREGNKGLLRLNSHHLPVTGHGIFAAAGFSKPGITPQRFLYVLHLSAGVEIQHSQFSKIGNIKGSHGVKNMSEGICSGISELLRIRQSPDAERIHNYHKNSVIVLHVRLPALSQSLQFYWFQDGLLQAPGTS